MLLTGTTATALRPSHFAVTQGLFSMWKEISPLKLLGFIISIPQARISATLTAINATINPMTGLIFRIATFTSENQATKDAHILTLLI